MKTKPLINGSWSETDTKNGIETTFVPLSTDGRARRKQIRLITEHAVKHGAVVLSASFPLGRRKN